MQREFILMHLLLSSNESAEDSFIKVLLKESLKIYLSRFIGKSIGSKKEGYSSVHLNQTIINLPCTIEAFNADSILIDEIALSSLFLDPPKENVGAEIYDTWSSIFYLNKVNPSLQRVR